MKVVVAKDIITRFGKKIVHDGLSFEINQGEIFGFLGGSGSGKSTLLREIMSLQKYKGGSLQVLSYDLASISSQELQKLREQYGVLFQFGALFSSLTVLENISIALKEYTNLSNEAIRDAALMKLNMVGLDNSVAHLYPSELSGGMKKRVGLARALALDPKILLLDEPTSGLDPKSARAFDELTLALRESLGITVIMVTHDKDTISDVLDRFLILKNKKIGFLGDIQALRETRDKELLEFLN